MAQQQTPKRTPQPIVGVSVGEPTELAGMARMLLPYLTQPALRLVTPDEQSSDPLPAELEGPV